MIKALMKMRIGGKEVLIGETTELDAALEVEMVALGAAEYVDGADNVDPAKTGRKK